MSHRFAHILCPFPRLARRVLCALACLLLVAPAARAQLGMQTPEEEQGLDIDEKLGNTLPLQLTVTNADNQQVQISKYFDPSDKRPALMLMVYFECPVICDVLMQRLSETINDLDLDLGKDYKVIIFSFDPTETVEQAHDLHENFLAGYNREVTQQVRDSWQFHVSDGATSRELANAVGFKYKKLANGQYSHPVCLFVLTPEGKVSRYIYGFSYPQRDVKLALMEASQGKLAKSLGDRLMAFCYMYDPQKGSYSVAAYRVMQLGGAITFVLLSGLIATLVIAESIRRKRLAKERAGDEPPNQPTPMMQ